jgi:NAD dependent epimerase/dehydratase family enzyme
MKELTQTIAIKEHSKIILPNIPSFVIRLIFGEMGMLLTESLRIDHTKLNQSDYTLSYPQLKDLLHDK